MDLSALKPGERTVEIMHPATGEPLGIRVRIVSIDDESVRKLRRLITDDRLKLEARGKTLKTEDVEENGRRLLFATMKGWEWYNPTGNEGDDGYDADKMPSFNGEVPTFNQRNFNMLIDALPWFAQQLNEAHGETKDFFDNSAPS